MSRTPFKRFDLQINPEQEKTFLIACEAMNIRPQRTGRDLFQVKVNTGQQLFNLGINCVLMAVEGKK